MYIVWVFKMLYRWVFFKKPSFRIFCAILCEKWTKNRSKVYTSQLFFYITEVNRGIQFFLGWIVNPNCALAVKNLGSWQAFIMEKIYPEPKICRWRKNFQFLEVYSNEYFNVNFAQIKAINSLFESWWRLLL